MSFIPSREHRLLGTDEHHHLITVPTAPAVEKRCGCHGTPMHWRKATAKNQAGWECRVDSRLRGVKAQRVRTERLAAVERDGHTRAEVFEAGGGKCWICGVALDPAGKWDQDHVVPIARGGADTLENVRPACVDCNRAKGMRLYLD